MRKMENKIIKRLAEEVWENLLWEGMEAVLFEDGEVWVRQKGTVSSGEDEVIYKVDLGPHYWADSFGVEMDEEGNLSTDPEMQEEFVQVFLEETSEFLDY